MRYLPILILSFSLSAKPVLADSNTTYNMYGVPGLLEMPTAQMAPDGELATSFSYAGETLRNTLTFQVGPRLSGAFRYTQVDKYNAAPGALYGGKTYDRSFDLRYQVLTEGQYRPAVAVGLQDIIGTGLYAGEYVVATKNIGPVAATVGLGWGRLGTFGSFDNPLGAISNSFDTRPTGTTGLGGQFETGKWFRGPAAAFAGVSWAINDKLTLKAEYSSDAQTLETVRNHYVRKSPVNFGLDYQWAPRTQLSLYSLYGSEVGVLVNFHFDPKNHPDGGTADPSPFPVMPRSQATLADLGWSNSLTIAPAMMQNMAKVLLEDGILLDGLTLTDSTATIRITNKRYGAQAQAVGHVARLLSNVMPRSVDTFVIVPMVQGLQGSQVVIARDGLDRFEHAPNGAAQILATTQVLDAASINRRAGLAADRSPRFTWNLGPYAHVALFDPNNPIALNLGIELNAEWVPTPGLSISGSVRQGLVDNFTSTPRFSNSILEHVRSDATFYQRTDEPVIEHLTAAYLFRPGKNLYGRVTAGYLERMYGGISAELLWKPVGSRLALGAEVNYAKQRSFDGGFGFAPKTITAAVNHISGTDTIGPARNYDVVTGHVSAYYELTNGFHAQLDVGRYLAKDWGATFSLDREFNNGWRVGAYATLTDVPFADFGEGSFDKGIRVIIPLSWQLGKPTRQASTTILQPISRDGGARLQVRDRLYEVVRDTHAPQLEARWARFWR